MTRIQNPILKGFNPDPSILRVDEDYFIAVSTFEWFPGIQIYHSKDLAHWRLLCRPLERISQLDLKGVSNSGGVWAPCLSYSRGLFYLVYTVVTHFDRTLFLSDYSNFLVTAKDITGEWSEPIFLNASGFDPSLFHDEDGRKWFLNMLWDARKGHKNFGGILLQEYSHKEKSLVGPIWNIFKGSPLGLTEGPHLYKVNGRYYLVTAEGGTSWDHAVTVARSERIEGPYEIDPENPVLTASDDPSYPIQKVGHASWVQTQNGEWYLVHLGSRPLTQRGRCVLGRETFIQKIAWTPEGWIRLDGGGRKPLSEVPAPSLKAHPWPPAPQRDDFNSKKLSLVYQTLRMPLGEDTRSLRERPGFLRLKGRNFLNSLHLQAFVARRQEDFSYSASTALEFEPEGFQQMAGLVCFYDTTTFYYLYISRDEHGGKCIGIVMADRARFDYPLDSEISIEGWKRVYLKVEVRFFELRFFYSKDGSSWSPIGPVLDASKLSDDYVSDYSFTGAFVGLCCQDLSGRRLPADFDYFEYQPL